MSRKHTRDRIQQPIVSGCEYFNDCFNCPFPDCIVDLSWVEKDEIIRQYLGMGITEAKELGKMR